MGPHPLPHLDERVLYDEELVEDISRDIDVQLLDGQIQRHFGKTLLVQALHVALQVDSGQGQESQG